MLLIPSRLERQIERKREQLKKTEVLAKSKDELKTVALGTSKINYLDPRITVAWCKLHEVRPHLSHALSWGVVVQTPAAGRYLEAYATIMDA